MLLLPQDVVPKFETEIRKDPLYHIQDRYLFKTYNELASFYELATKYHELTVDPLVLLGELSDSILDCLIDKLVYVNVS